jgi:regulatory protein
VTWVIERLRAQGYLDDADYARQVARSRLVTGGIAKRRVQDELFRKGVDRAAATEAIDETFGEVEHDEYAAALAAGRKRIRVLQSEDVTTQRRRLYAFLARRGFQPDIVGRVVRTLLHGDDHEVEEVAGGGDEA